MTDRAHTIFVGGKPFMNYVTAVVMQFTTRGAEDVVVKSRGKFIYRAVDIAEVVKSRFLKDQVEVGNISIGSEEFTNKEGKQVRVSTMDIQLKRAVEGPVQATIDVPGVPRAPAPEPTAEETSAETPSEDEVEPEVPVEEVAEEPAEPEPEVKEETSEEFQPTTEETSAETEVTEEAAESPAEAEPTEEAAEQSSAETPSASESKIRGTAEETSDGEDEVEPKE